MSPIWRLWQEGLSSCSCSITARSSCFSAGRHGRDSETVSHPHTVDHISSLVGLSPRVRRPSRRGRLLGATAGDGGAACGGDYGIRVAPPAYTGGDTPPMGGR